MEGIVRRNIETSSKHHVFSLGGNLKKNIYTDQSGILHQIALCVGTNCTDSSKKRRFLKKK